MIDSENGKNGSKLSTKCENESINKALYFHLTEAQGFIYG